MNGSYGRFLRERLPAPHGYYECVAKLRLSKGSGPWRSARCPFCEDAIRVFRVNVETGAFRCFGCGVKGADIIDFHRRRYGLSFALAARALGAWQMPEEQQA